jgi:hypothetical protein
LIDDSRTTERIQYLLLKDFPGLFSTTHRESKRIVCRLCRVRAKSTSADVLAQASSDIAGLSNIVSGCGLCEIHTLPNGIGVSSRGRQF